jgi:hypothetical protein
MEVCIGPGSKQQEVGKIRIVVFASCRVSSMLARVSPGVPNMKEHSEIFPASLMSFIAWW